MQREDRDIGCAMSQPRIRPLAICVFRYNGRILAAEGVDPVKNNLVFYRHMLLKSHA